MLNRPAVDEARRGSADRSHTRRWPLAFVGCAGVLGAAGVAVGAAASHGSGSEVARTASEFLLIHAAAVVGGAGVGLASPRTSGALVAALTFFVVGSSLFGGELAASGLWEWRPFPLAAPTGGLCLIGGWLMLAVAGATLARHES